MAHLRALPQRFCKECEASVGKGKSYCAPCRTMRRVRQGQLTYGPQLPPGYHRGCAPRPPRICQNPFCGKEFHGRYYGWRDKGGARRQKFCSQECSGSLRYGGVLGCIIISAVSEARQSLKREASEILKEIRRGQAQLKREDFLKRNRAGRRCKLCGEWFKHGGDVKYCRDYCATCRDRGLSFDRFEKFGCAWETVNPRIVFERDNWTCQHCGYATPEWLRGLGAEGPTLDHILPIAKGGAHSYANTQCLCHTCNSIKSDRIDREPKLIGVEDFTPYKVAKIPAGQKRDQQPPKECACRCGAMFTPFVDGNADYKIGHWSRTPERKCQQHITERKRIDKERLTFDEFAATCQYSHVGESKPYTSLGPLLPGSRLAKKLARSRASRNQRRSARVAARRDARVLARAHAAIISASALVASLQTV